MNYKNKTRQSLSQFIIYSLVGTTNIIIEIIILNILSFTTGITSGKMLFVFNIISFSIYSISSYKLNKKFTFKETSPEKGYLQYASVLFFSMLLNSFMLVLLTSRNPLIPLLHHHRNIIHLNHLWFNISILIDSTIVGLLGFLINKFFVFNKKKTC